MLRALLGLAQNGTFNNPTFTGVISGACALIAQSFVPVSAGADITEDTLATITVPAGRLGANGALLAMVHWTFTGAGGTKTGRIRYSGGAGTIIASQTATTANEYGMAIIVGNKNATNAQGTLIWSLTNVGATIADSAIDTTASTSIVITGQKASAGDGLTLKGYTVWTIR